MDVYYLTDSTPSESWRDMPGVQRGATCAAWPRLTSLDSRGLLLRDCARSLADARRHAEAKPAPKTLRGGVQFVYDPLASTMAHPLGMIGLFR
jgi:hypothetical protein